MKYIILTISLFFVFLTSAFSQGCLHSGITFSSQSGIDNFHSDYPGCTTIEGAYFLSFAVVEWIDVLTRNE